MGHGDTRWDTPVQAAIVMLLLAPSAFAQLRPGQPAAAGMSAARLERAAQLLSAEVESGGTGAASVLVARRGRIVLHRGYGRLSPAKDAPPVRPDSVYLLASITKPVTACALMLLVERGKVSLSDPVRQYLPEFAGGERDNVLVRDLLSHTSGLPDMLPENVVLRRAHAPLSDFVKATYKTPLLFAPRTDVRYQSMGILLAGEIVEKLSGMRLRDFEQKEIFGPLGMKDSALGLGGRSISASVLCPPGANAADDERFGPNTLYWRDMGHPWGGMHSTTSDLAILLQTFLNGGAYAGVRIFSPATVAAMTSDQNTRLNAPWGLGWALGRSRIWNACGDLVSPKTFLHSGATGTVAWADPETQLLCVILTNRPYATDNGRLLRLVSNAAAAAIEE